MGMDKIDFKQLLNGLSLKKWTWSVMFVRFLIPDEISYSNYVYISLSLYNTNKAKSN